MGVLDKYRKRAPAVLSGGNVTREMSGERDLGRAIIFPKKITKNASCEWTEPRRRGTNSGLVEKKKSKGRPAAASSGCSPRKPRQRGGEQREQTHSGGGTGRDKKNRSRNNQVTGNCEGGTRTPKEGEKHGVRVGKSSRPKPRWVGEAEMTISE